MENKNIELIEGGLICDNSNCDYENKEVLSKDYIDWLNKPCPKCGDNLLTEDDFNNFKKIRAVADLFNALSPKEIEAMGKAYGYKPNLESDFFKDAEGLEALSSKGKISMTLSTHKEIKAVKIKRLDNEN